MKIQLIYKVYKKMFRDISPYSQDNQKNKFQSLIQKFRIIFFMILIILETKN